MKRKDFLSTLSGGLAVTCVSCLTLACSKEAMNAPTPVSSPSTGSNPSSNVFTVNLATELKAVNDFVAKSGIIVIRTSTNNVAASFNAFSSVCPHAGSTVEYNNSKSSFLCAAHGSTFNADGSLGLGPATRGLTKLVVDVTGTNLTVKS